MKNDIIYNKKKINMKKKVQIDKASFIQLKHGKISDDYDICEHEIGRGSFGVVYKARKYNLHQSKLFAIKRLNKLNIKDLMALGTEMKILRTVDHPSIIKLHEVYEDQSFLYLVTDLCDGGQLFEAIIKNGSFCQRDARYIFTQIIQAVGYCHKNKIAHRDLKPQNFLLRKKDSFELSLIDFGLAYQWEDSMKYQISQMGQKKIIGTCYYIAPQILVGPYDERCDLWSIGVILYILVSGRPPFDGDTDKQIMMNVYKREYSLNVPEMKNVSIDLKDLIFRLLQPQKNRLSIEEIYQHPWMQNDVSTEPLHLNFSRMQNYAKFSKFKKIIANYIALYFSPCQVDGLGKLFKQIDSNHDGLISLDELVLTLEKQKEGKSLGEVQQIFEQIDGRQKINYTEFLASTVEESQVFRQENIAHVFNMIDANKNGTIDRQQLQNLLLQTDFESLNGLQVDEMLSKFDSNKDGAIDFQEFLSSLQK